MSSIRLVAAALSAVLIAACAGMQSGPAPEVRQSLAPSGKLRVGLLLGNPVHVVRDAASGEMKGVGHDLGRELAARLGVPFEPVLYPGVGPFLDGAKVGAWDIAFIGVNPERGKFLDFTANHLEIDFGYLVPPGSRISAIGDVDQPGVRVAVVERGSPDLFLTRALKSATLVRAAGFAGAQELLNSKKADVIGAVKPNLYAASAQLSGSRVLDGRPGSEEQAMALPKGRSQAAAAYARRFIEDAKAGGLVKASIERAGLRGVVVAPGG